MYKYMKYALLATFFHPPKIYFILLGIFVIGIMAVQILPDIVRLGDYRNAEQDYRVQVGFILDNGKAVPKEIWYIGEDGKRRKIPPKNVKTVQRPCSNIYDSYCRIRRRDGTGYDYVHGIMQRLSDTEFRQLKVTHGREIGT